MNKKEKPKGIVYEEPINIFCPKCKCWLARVNAVKIKDGYICKMCLKEKNEKKEM